MSGSGFKIAYMKQVTDLLQVSVSHLKTEDNKQIKINLFSFEENKGTDLKLLKKLGSISGDIWPGETMLLEPNGTSELVGSYSARD